MILFTPEKFFLIFKFILEICALLRTQASVVSWGNQGPHLNLYAFGVFLEPGGDTPQRNPERWGGSSKYELRGGTDCLLTHTPLALPSFVTFVLLPPFSSL